MLHARVADYDPGWCDLLYERRTVFEAYNKGLSLVPSSEFAWFRATLSRNAPRILAESGTAESGERALERGWAGRPAVRREHLLDRQGEERAQPLGDLLARHARAEPPLVDLEAPAEVDERVEIGRAHV